MYVVVGYLLHDIVDVDGKISESPGGSAMYCSMTAKKLGMKVGIVSRVGQDYRYHDILDGIDKSGVGMQEKTTTFFDIYRDGRRKELVFNIGKKLRKKDFPREFLNAKAVHIGPVIDEVHKGLIKMVKKKSSALITADIQGFIRKEKNGDVVPKKFKLGILKYIDILHCSEDDLRDSRIKISDIERKCNHILLTRNSRGSVLIWDSRRISIPPFNTIEKDPTGAGDVYMAAFAKRFLETNDPEESGRYASAAASFCVEDFGINGIKDERHVIERLRTGERN